MATYAIKGNEKILVTNENKDSLVGYKFIQESNEKEEMILKYKSLQKEISEIKAEIQDLVDTYESKDDNGKALSNARTTVLETRLGEKRKESDSLALEGVEKFGEAVIAEF